MTRPIISIERVGSIPIVLHTLQKSGFIDLVNAVFPPHKNWSGLPMGETVAIWLCYMITRSDHRMCKVEDWIRPKGRLLREIFKRPIFKKHFTDDRLARVLDKFSISEDWERFEIRFNESFIRIYGIPLETIRLDMTTANSGGIVSENGILQFGNSKDDPKRPQIKIGLATVDPLGIPITVNVVPGNAADDPLYVPLIKKVQASTRKKGLLFLGDCKMGAISTRSFIANNEFFYICPLSEVAHSTDELSQAIQRFSGRDGTYSPVFREYEDGEVVQIAEGFEEIVLRSAGYNGAITHWQERLVYAKSFGHANKETAHLDSRIKHANEKILALNNHGRGKKVYHNLSEINEKVDSILQKFAVKGLISVSIEETIITEQKRGYGKNPPRIIEYSTFHVTSEVVESEYQQKKDLFGWKVYATNKAASDLSLEKVVLSYRDQFIIEHEFHRLKGKSLSLTPLYIQKGNRIVGLVHLLTIALRILGLIEFSIHSSIKQRGMPLEGLVTYNPTRTLKKPKSERILEFFDDIEISTVKVGDEIYYYIHEFTDKHREILSLLDIDCNIYFMYGEIH